jgi:hypothetical protein
LEDKAEKFASTEYFNDLIVSLQNKFNITESFKTKLAGIFTTINWFDQKSLNFSTTSKELNYRTDEECLIIELDIIIHYLSSWEYNSTTSFIFTFDVVQDGEMKKKTFFLSPRK